MDSENSFSGKPIRLSSINKRSKLKRRKKHQQVIQAKKKQKIQRIFISKEKNVPKKKEKPPFFQLLLISLRKHIRKNNFYFIEFNIKIGFPNYIQIQHPLTKLTWDIYFNKPDQLAIDNIGKEITLSKGQKNNKFVLANFDHYLLEVKQRKNKLFISNNQFEYYDEILKYLDYDEDETFDLIPEIAIPEFLYAIDLFKYEVEITIEYLVKLRDAELQFGKDSPYTHPEFDGKSYVTGTSTIKKELKVEYEYIKKNNGSESAINFVNTLITQLETAKSHTNPIEKATNKKKDIDKKGWVDTVLSAINTMLNAMDNKTLKKYVCLLLKKIAQKYICPWL
jgi:hypothetical protein